MKKVKRGEEMHKLPLLLFFILIQVKLAHGVCKKLSRPFSTMTSIADIVEWKNKTKKYFPELGCYSHDYQSDWSVLDDGQITGKFDLKSIKQSSETVIEESQPYLYNVNYDTSSYYADELLILKDIHKELTWQQGKKANASTKNAYIVINNVKYILLENLAISQTTEQDGVDTTVFPINSIVINGCDTVVIKDSYFSGAIRNHHIKIENCKNVIIDKVEFAGTSPGGDFSKYNVLGGAIKIDNCLNAVDSATRSSYCSSRFTCSDLVNECVDQEWFNDFSISDFSTTNMNCPGQATSTVGTNTVTYQGGNPGFTILQNIYIHDHETGIQYKDSKSDLIEELSHSTNHDAINIHSPGDGMIFNIFIENWQATTMGIDAAIDFGHGRVADSKYTDKRFFVERSVFLDAGYIKTPTVSDSSNIIGIVGNLMYNTSYLDYHKNYTVHLAYNTMLFDGDTLVPTAYDLGEIPLNATTKFTGNLIGDLDTSNNSFSFFRSTNTESSPNFYEVDAYSNEVPGGLFAQFNDLANILENKGNFYINDDYKKGPLFTKDIEFFFEYDAAASCSTTSKVQFNEDYITTLKDYDSFFNDSESKIEGVPSNCYPKGFSYSSPSSFIPDSSCVTTNEYANVTELNTKRESLEYTMYSQYFYGTPRVSVTGFFGFPWYYKSGAL